MIMGNKIDLLENRQVDRELGEGFCNERGFKFHEVSAISDSPEVQNIFNSFIIEIARNKIKENKFLYLEEIDKQKNTLIVIQNNNSNRKCKC